MDNYYDTKLFKNKAFVEINSKVYLHKKLCLLKYY